MTEETKIYNIENVEVEAVAQFTSAMIQPFSKRGSLMADAHLGYSLPIGGVVGTAGWILPSWVGYDIGCGVCALRTTFVLQDLKDNAEALFSAIYEAIPMGYHHNKRPITWRDYKGLNKTPFLDQMFHQKKGFHQLGTLGSGNHFIEIGYDENEVVVIIIHSGSRNVGHSVATYYMKEACFLHEGVRKAREGHYGFSVDSKLGGDYIVDMELCLKFALVNRKIMLQRIVEAMQDLMEGEADWDTLINRTHNHAEYNQDLRLWIHRKGATHAEEGMYGVIPGNMRDGSFIVRGKGCEQSLFSSSHGAGRVLSRTAAKKDVELSDFVRVMHDAGITAKVGESTKDESPFAYKNIFEVMDAQKDLVEVVSHIKPIVNIKG
jgi:tRNA-splicing ligase RtcB